MSEDTASSWVGRIEHALHAFWVRLLLSLLILASLLPHPADQATDIAFLIVFGLELALRIAVFVNPPPDNDRRGTRRRALTALSLAIDLVALLTFVPWAGLTGLAEARWLRLVRLLRMLLLIGYWSPILRDTWHVLARHDRMRQVSLLGLIVGLLAFAGATVLAHIAVDHTDFNGDGLIGLADQSFWPRLWWAFRQIQDPGNMINDPGEITVVIVSLLLTVAGLFVVSFLIGLATDVVRELVALARSRPIGWNQHTVVVNATPGLPRLLTELLQYYEKLFRKARIIVADQADEPPNALRTGELAQVRWRQIDERGAGLTEQTDLHSARRVVVLAKAAAPFPDAQAAATVLDVRDANARAWVVVEVLDPNNAAAARIAGGALTVVVSSEKLLGVWALAAIRRPEQLPLAWDLLATSGGAEIYTCFFDADGLPGPGRAWLPAAGRFVDLVTNALTMRQDLQDKRRHFGGVVPIGLIYQRHAVGGSHDDGELVLGPERVEARPVRALVAIGERFNSVQRLALKLHAGGLEGQPLTARSLELGPLAAGLAAPKKVLVCGFRPGTAVVCAGLLADDGGAGTDILLVMRHEESVREAAQTLREHGLGETRGRCFAGHFALSAAPTDAAGPASEMRFVWVPDSGVVPAGGVTLVRADWTSERTLAGLEPGVEHVSAYDLVLLMGAHLPEYDGRTSMACLKIANLVRATPERFRNEQRILAGIADTELGRRLELSFTRAVRDGGPRINVIPTEDLRALFVFQSIAVPGWESIFLELLAPGGKGLVRRTFARADDQVWRFAEIAAAVAPEGVLLALEMVDGTRAYAPPPGAPGARARDISALWLLADE